MTRIVKHATYSKRHAPCLQGTACNSACCVAGIGLPCPMRRPKPLHCGVETQVRRRHRHTQCNAWGMYGIRHVARGIGSEAIKIVRGSTCPLDPEVFWTEHVPPFKGQRPRPGIAQAASAGASIDRLQMRRRFLAWMLGKRSAIS